MGLMKRIAVQRFSGGGRSKGGSSSNIDFTFFVDRVTVTSRVDKKVLKVLSAAGAYAKGAIKNSIRPQKTNAKISKLVGIKGRLVTVNAREYFVPLWGKVLDATTLKVARKSQADAARAQLAATRQAEGYLKPPRRGPDDLLRRFIFFGVDPSKEEVVVGAMPFRKQPAFSGGIVSVPQLLEEGGGEYIGGRLAQYFPRPFVEPAKDAAVKNLKRLIEKIPL